MYRNTDFKLVFFGRKQLQHIFPFSVADALSWCSFNSAINLHALFLFQHFVKITGGTRLWDLAAESGLELYPADLTCSPLSGATLVLHRLKCVHRLIINHFFFFLWTVIDHWWLLSLEGFVRIVPIARSGTNLSILSLLLRAFYVCFNEDNKNNQFLIFKNCACCICSKLIQRLPDQNYCQNS